MTARPGVLHPGPEPGILLVAAAVVAGVVFWGAGALSALLAGDPVPSHRPLAGVDALGHFSDPAIAWGAPVGPVVLYWCVVATVTLCLAAFVSVTARVITRRRRSDADDPSRIEGLASRSHVVAAAGAGVLVARAKILRPSLERAQPRDVGLSLGKSKGVECWVSVEDSIFVLGPPRSGKGLHLVIPAILDYPGAVITTATRPDNLAVTLALRSEVGPVGVFDPQGLASGVSAALRWSPVRGCERPQTALTRAAALCEDAGGEVESGSFWRQQTLMVLRCLLHAAALGERAAADLYRWSLTPAAAREAVDILVRAHGAAQAWDRALDGIISADSRQRDSVWAMVANSLSGLADPKVLDAVTPAVGEEFDPVRFLTERGCLYLLGTASGAASTSGLVAALVEDVVEVARRLAAASPGGRLDPPLALVLDEAANYPLPSLPALMSEGGGTGITTMAVLQSLDQARHRWGRDEAGAIWDAAIAKVILPGVSNPDDLSGISRLVGNRKEREVTETRQPGGGTSVSSSTRATQVLPPAMIRGIRSGHALMLLRSAKPIMATLAPWTARKDAPALTSERGDVEAAIRSAAANSVHPPCSVTATIPPEPREGEGDTVTPAEGSKTQ